MSLLSEDYCDNWCDWKIEIYSGLDRFIDNPCEEIHDEIAKHIRENCTKVSYLGHNAKVIAICKGNRKRDAIAIMGPTPDRFRDMYTWKCSKHTPMNMRGMWVQRRYSNSLYINDTDKFLSTHEIYRIPDEIYDALLQQFQYK